MSAHHLIYSKLWHPMPMRTVSCAVLATVALLLIGYARQSQNASEQLNTDTCYDFIIAARIKEQLPITLGQSDSGEIIVQWPWFLVLDIDRVIEGRHPEGQVVALNMQHTYFRESPPSRIWYLRKNSDGMFNIQQKNSACRAPCPNDLAPQPSFVRPGKDAKLLDLLETYRAKQDRTEIIS